MRVSVFNVKYSPNLGDGLIADCLEWQLGQAGLDAGSLDLAGRDGHVAPRGGGRIAALQLLQSLPPAVRRSIVRARLGSRLSRQLRPKWKAELAASEAVVIGGGQLFADADLNFPLKLSAALAEAAGARLPVALYGVGVAGHMSQPALDMLAGALERARIVYIGVRDAASLDAWAGHFGDLDLPRPRLCRDPGLIAARVHPFTPHAPRPRPRVGLGIAHPLALGYHADGVALKPAEIERSFVETAGLMLEAGYDVVCFTNGAEEDEAYLAQLSPRLALLDGEDRLTVASRPRDPRSLAHLVAGLDGLVAHRLHANILAYAYRRPSIGLGWDSKVRGFFRSVGLGNRALEAGDARASIIVERLGEAIQRGIDEPGHARTVADAAQGIERLAEALRVVCGKAQSSDQRGTSAMFSPTSKISASA